MKILSSGDWHINLHKKKIPYKWQKNRFKLFFDKLLELEQSCDVHIISGDVFDVAPQADEVCLLLTYINKVTIPTIIIPGNHEATDKGKSFLEHFSEDNAVSNPNVSIYTKNTRVTIKGVTFQLYPYCELQVDNLPKYVENDILVTHVRGEVLPHITPEYDFEKFRPWKLVLTSDLHFNHKYKDYPIYYPGSPMNTTFDRDSSRAYGIDIIDFNSVDDYKTTFVNLKLPKLIRKTITVKDELIKEDYDHVIYEVTGTIDQLAKVSQNVLLDKKIVDKPTNSSVLNLKNMTVYDELVAYLTYIKVKDKDRIIKAFKGLGIQ